MSNKPIFYTPSVAGSLALRDFLGTVPAEVLLHLRNTAAAAADPAAKPIASLKSPKSGVKMIATIVEEQEKAGKIFAITVDGDRSFVAFAPPSDIPPVTNALLTRHPDTLKAQADTVKKTVADTRERVITNPKTPPKPATAAASKARVDGSLVLKKLFDKNPRREGSKAAERLALLTDGMTVEQFVAAVATVGNRLDKKLARRARRLVKKSVAAGHLELVDATRAAIEKDRASKAPAK